MDAIVEQTTPMPVEAAETEPIPTPITGADFKRVARTANKDTGRYAINNIEINPTGLVATNGRILIVINAPGKEFTGYVDAKDVKAIANTSELSVNGAVQFVSINSGVQTSTTVPHKTAKDVVFPNWPKILPDASNLAPIGSFDIEGLKALLTALQRNKHDTVTIYTRVDNQTRSTLLANAAGDLGLVMPVTEKKKNKNMPVADFPNAIYEAHGKLTETAGSAAAKSCCT